jgi:hypothetical protein
MKKKLEEFKRKSPKNEFGFDFHPNSTGEKNNMKDLVGMIPGAKSHERCGNRR